MKSAAAPAPAARTPMMEQYARAKREYSDCILLFRMGDFYETFYEDAELVSRELGLTLTAREKDEAQRVPLAGIPWHALEGYLVRLVRLGHRVAICEQVEDAAQAKGLVERRVVRVVTAGTLIEESALDAARNNDLVALAPDGDRVGVARVDFSTGEFEAGEVPAGRLEQTLRRMEAAEVLAPRGMEEEGSPLRAAAGEGGRAARWTPLDGGAFLPELGERILCEQFGVASLDGFGLGRMPRAVAAAGAAMHYLRRAFQGPLHHVSRVRLLGESSTLVLDETAVRTLELVDALHADRPQTTLFAVMNRTATPMGARLLRRWLVQPLCDRARIEERLDAVAELVERGDVLDRMQTAFGGLRDMERLVSRVGCERATPRDLAALGDVLQRVPSCAESLGERNAPLLAGLGARLAVPGSLREELARALAPAPPVVLHEGGILRDGYHDELDRLRVLMGEGKDWVARLQETERSRTGISTLRVGFNRVFGYYLEVSRSQLGLVPPQYERRQTLVGAERFVTAELKAREAEILGAEESANRLERELFLALRARAAAESAALMQIARSLAELDVLGAFARTARERRMVRPRLDDSTRIMIQGGRHPVVESALPPEQFVPNDLELDAGTRQILLITGPNMAGKSTYLRQAALIVVLAQCGSFVPAASAEIGLVDRIFTRVGAADDLARGRSTFLVEMQEAASILHNATRRSLVLLDEVGRGTSTYDGLSIAWALAEHLHDAAELGSRTLFATHYHELTALARDKPRIVNLNVAVREWGDRVVFLHEIREGTSDRSYGIHVARLAGMPPEVIARAREVLAALERGEQVERATLPHPGAGEGQFNLFEADPRAAAVQAELARLDANAFTPRDAMEWLYRWSAFARGEEDA